MPETEKKQTSPKNLVVCCDGTGNQFGSVVGRSKDGKPIFENNNSNVVRLYTCLEVGPEQMAYYHPGVGTMGSPTSRNRVERWWSKVKGLGFGMGFTDNMADAYRFLMQNYADGDRIYLFGFSRGAYTVRALAGALSMYGLLCPGNEGHLNYMLGMYADASKRAFNRDHTVPRRLDESIESRAFRETFSRTVPIHFMGVWDTVSSVGWIWDPVKLLYDGQNPIIRKARHAISIDERRCFFQAMPWGDPMNLNDQTMKKEEREKLLIALSPGWESQDIVQAWFPGVHSDVGGSYRFDQAGPALTAFEWMLEEAREDDLLIQHEKEQAVKGKHSPRYEGIRRWNHPQPAPLEWFHESLSGPWWILEVFPHKYFDEAGRKHWQLEPWPHRRAVPGGSLMHPAVRKRLGTGTYAPPNLQLDKLHPLDASNGPILKPEVRTLLINHGFEVYGVRRKSGAEHATALPKVAATVCVAIGVAAYLLSRLR